MNTFIDFDPNQIQSHHMLGEFREWMSLQYGDYLSNDGKPIWMKLIEANAWECIQELIKDIDIGRVRMNDRDKQGRGWLHYSIYNAMPSVLSIEALALLDDTWNKPDKHNNTPMQALPEPPLAQAMAKRWWAKNANQSNRKFFFNTLAKQAHQGQRLDIERIWLFWSLK